MKRGISLCLSVLLALGMLFSGSALAAQTDYSYADTLSFDALYDVVVVGFGGSGAVAAKTAADEGASVLIVEKAPEGHEGGNTRYCGQLFAYGNNDIEATMSYYKALYGDFDVPQAMLDVLCDHVARMADILADDFGAVKENFTDWTGKKLGAMSPEYPEFPGSEKIGLWSTNDKYSDATLWNLLRKNVTDRADKIDVWFESPAVSLIQDPQTKTILGVTVERGGKTLNVRAQNGVVMATGGFENNKEMVADYLGLASFAPIGGLYNTGDGIKMAMAVGADLWHMEVYEGISILGACSFPVGENERGRMLSANLRSEGSYMMLSGDGHRFLREDEGTRHGHIYQGDIWRNPNYPARIFLVFDQKQYDADVATEAIPEGTEILSAETVAELAEKLSMDPAILEETISTFNGYAEQGKDPQFGRMPESMAKLEGTLYAAALVPNILNTQGGPRRNENAEVLNVAGAPIPHLYSAGEMGGMTASHYQGGTNIAECITFGSIAGKNAAQPKDALPAYVAAEPVAQNIVYTLGVETDLKAAETVEASANEKIGEGSGMGGPLTVKVTMDGDKIVSVEIVNHSESAGISDPAIDQIPKAIVEKQSADVDIVSGATITSNAIIEAVKNALTK